MTLLYPQVLWLFIPLGLLFWVLKPKTLMQTVHLLILGLLILSLARPQLREGLQEERIDAKDILIALDVSYSMRAQDLSPDRYTYAKETIKALLKKNTKDNIMLIAFTTNPLLLSPPTTDHRLILTALEALEPKNILTKGTSLERLFQKISSLKKIEREVLLMTDGGEENDLQKLLNALHGTPLHLNILALGTNTGTTIPTEEGGMLKDREKHLVVSRINPMLKQLADATGGNYLTASSSAAKDANMIAALFHENADKTRSVNKLRYSYTELYFIPLLLAIIFFLMLHTRASRYLLLLFTLVGVQIQAGFLDGLSLQKAYGAYDKHDYMRTTEILSHIETPSLQQQYALAAAHYRLGNYKKARLLFRTIRTTSPQLKQKLYYNIANSYAMEGMYDKARIYYTKALQLGEDADAAHNLALVIHATNRQASQLCMAHPKSQNSDSTQSGAQEKESDEKARSKEDQSNSGSGSGGEKEQQRGKEDQPKGRLKLDERAQPQPLSSKVYELINKGYIRETQPW